MATIQKETINFGAGGATATGNPTGTIIAFMGTIPPEGYLACDGTVYNVEDYSNLANFFLAQFSAVNYFGGDGESTFAVPDLRAEFLRTNPYAGGLDGNGAAVGVHQMASRHGTSNVTGGMYYFTSYKLNDGTRLALYDYKGSNAVYRDNSSIYNKGSYYTYYTDRPTNTSVLWCIKI